MVITNQNIPQLDTQEQRSIEKKVAKNRARMGDPRVYEAKPRFMSYQWAEMFVNETKWISNGNQDMIANI